MLEVVDRMKMFQWFSRRGGGGGGGHSSKHCKSVPVVAISINSDDAELALTCHHQTATSSRTQRQHSRNAGTAAPSDHQTEAAENRFGGGFGSAQNHLVSRSSNSLLSNTNATLESSPTLNRSGSIPVANPALRTVLEDSPSSPPPKDNHRWLKVLSLSRRGSPKGSISSLPDWVNAPPHPNDQSNIDSFEGLSIDHNGTVSTMGSPWNSKAGHFDRRCQRYKKRTYKKGHWITTDANYVVLEL